MIKKPANYVLHIDNVIKVEKKNTMIEKNEYCRSGNIREV